jgi:diadenosine tetraphosphatase ApaH/serine/threonine PP2A family protein phosphatase
MKTAFVSDIHGNLTALEAVLADIDLHKVDEIVCLGDTVGYGPQPRECLALVRKRCNLVLMGNHENAVLNGAEHFTPLARIAIDWTSQQLRDPDILRYLSSLRPAKKYRGALLVHGSVRDPLFDYVREADSPWMFYRLVQTLREDFKGFELCFVGHNHRAFLGTEVGYIFPHSGDDSPRTKFHLENQKAYVSIGSVGQPRDGDRRASWVLYDGESVEFHRVEYDRQITVDLIHEAGLPEFLADRLLYGE